MPRWGWGWAEELLGFCKGWAGSLLSRGRGARPCVGAGHTLHAAPCFGTSHVWVLPVPPAALSDDGRVLAVSAQVSVGEYTCSQLLLTVWFLGWVLGAGANLLGVPSVPGCAPGG